MTEPPSIRPSGMVPHRMGRLFSRNRSQSLDLLRRCVAEVIGTWLLVFSGTSAVAGAVLAGAHVGLWQVGMVQALGVAMAIYITSPVSGAHLNPAVSLAFAIFRPRDFPRRFLLPYWLSQLLGAVMAGLTVLVLYNSFIQQYEDQHGLTRENRGASCPQ